MSASDSAEAGIQSNKRIAILRVLRERLKALSPLRWIFLILGIASIAYGQHIIEQRYSNGEWLPQATLWNDVYKLHIVNFDNVLHALPYLLGGAFLCALTVLPPAWKTRFMNWEFDPATREKFQWKRGLPYILIGGTLFIFLIVQLARHQYHPAYPFHWLISIIAFTIITWVRDKNIKKDLSPGIAPLDWFWIASLLLLGFAINSYALQDIPTILIADEGSFWENARTVAIHELEPAFFDSGVYSFPMASTIYQGWVLRIFGLNMWAWRFSSVIAGVLTVIPLYLLGREWFNRRVAVIAAALMVSHPYFIAFARMGYNNSQSLFPVVLAVCFFALAARKGSVFYLWLAGVAAGIGFYTYSAAWLGPVTLCLGILYLFLTKQVKWKQTLVSLGIVLLACGVMLAPRVAYAASGENGDGLFYKIFETSFVNTFYAKAYYGEADLLQTMPFIHFSNRDTIFYDPAIYKELLVRGTVRTLVSIFDPHIVREHFLVTGFAGSIAPVFFLIGLALSFRLWKQLRFGLSLIWLFAGLLFLSVIAAFPPRQTHLVSVIPVIALFSGIGLSAAVESLTGWMPSRWARVQPIVQRILLAATSIVIIYFGAQKYFVTMPMIYPPSFEDIASWIAWKTETPTDLIYLGQEDKPHRVGYLVDIKMTHHEYQSLLLNDFSPEIVSNGNRPTIIFLEDKDAAVDPKQWIMPGFSMPIPYVFMDGSIIGYVITNTVIDMDPHADREDGWGSLADTPVCWILILLIILCAISGAFRVQKMGEIDQGPDLI